MKNLTAERLRELMEYDADSGIFRWRTKRHAGRAVAVAVSGRGYRQISIDGERYYLHRLAVLYVTGAHPQDEVDHIDGNPRNNRLLNLRAVSRRQNAVRGVCFDRGKFKAQFDDGARNRHLGRFATEAEAAAAYRQAVIETHGEFAPLDARDPPSEADESYFLIVAESADETKAEAITRLGITEADIAGREVALIWTGITSRG
jgi:HNH endonuclease